MPREAFQRNNFYQIRYEQSPFFAYRKETSKKRPREEKPKMSLNLQERMAKMKKLEEKVTKTKRIKVPKIKKMESLI